MIRRRRRTLGLAMLFAFLSAGGLGVGLLSAGPILKIILDPEDPRSLAQIAMEHNAKGGALQVPAWIIEALPADPFRGVVVMIVGLIVLTVFGATANFLHQYMSQTVTTMAVADLRRDAFDVVLTMPLSRVVVRGPSEFVARIVRDAAELQRGLIALVSKSIAQVSKGVVAFVCAAVVEWRLTLVAMLVAPIVGVFLRKIGKRIRRGTRGSLEAQEGLLRISTEMLRGLRAVKASTGEAEASRRFAAVNDDVVHHELRVRTARAFSSPFVEFLGVIAIASMALVAAWYILSGSLALDRFMLALACLGVAGASLRPLAGLVTEVQASAAPAQRLADIIDEPAEADVPNGTPLEAHADRILFDAVSLRYPGADRNALTDVTLEVEHGERVAIVGPNGSGKTTLVSLLPRLLVPTSGRVLVDGTDVATVPLASLRRQVGVVTQETVLFQGSVAANIAFGLDGASRAEIESAARRAHAHEFIAQLAAGYDTDLAEMGASLSGGQRQRLAIARAILRDPRMLILDEATSQIDAESEALINTALAEFSRGRTTLIVAHRLATVLSANRIVVMDQGRILDAGRHDELLARCALYRRLAETQLVEREAG